MRRVPLGDEDHASKIMRCTLLSSSMDEKCMLETMEMHSAQLTFVDKEHKLETVWRCIPLNPFAHEKHAFEAIEMHSTQLVCG